MGRLLVSFCNTFPQGFPLGLYDFASGAFAWLPSPDSERLGGLPIGGASGLCWGGGEYHTILQHRVPGWPSTLVAYGPDLKARRAQRLNRVHDAHSLIWHDGALLVVSTGTNELIRLSWDVATGTVQEEPIWALGEKRRDSDHLNSVAWWQGRLCVSLHGPRHKGANSAELPAGRIIDVASGEILWGQLVHPHSLLAIDSALHFLESGRGCVWSLERKDEGVRAETVMELPGYLRGLAICGQDLFVASSAQRLRSKSKGGLMPPPHETREATHCFLYRVNLLSRQVEYRDLTPFGREIYDIVLLEDEAPLLLNDHTEEAIIRRQLAYDLEHQRALDDLSKAIEQYEALLSRSSVAH